MASPGDAVGALALALNAFLAEHRACWRLYGEGLERGEDGAVFFLECEAALPLQC
jgi:hypothetical protein